MGCIYICYATYTTQTKQHDKTLNHRPPHSGCDRWFEIKKKIKLFPGQFSRWLHPKSAFLQLLSVKAPFVWVLHTAFIPHPHQKKNKQNTKQKKTLKTIPRPLPALYQKAYAGSVNLVDTAPHSVTKETDNFFVFRKRSDIFKHNAMLNKHDS